MSAGKSEPTPEFPAGLGAPNLAHRAQRFQNAIHGLIGASEETLGHLGSSLCYLRRQVIKRHHPTVMEIQDPVK